MPDLIADVSRAVAKRLFEEFGSGVGLEVEEALQGGATHRPERFLDPVSLGGLVVSIATLGWTVFNDLRKKTPNPAPEIIARRIRVDLDTRDGVPTVERDRIIDVVVSEIISTNTDTRGQQM